MILDAGSESASVYEKIIMKAESIFWNGPLGVVEKDIFSLGTKSLCAAIEKSSGYCVAGGGETIYAIDKFGLRERINFISSGGGAFLEYLEDKPLPSVRAFIERDTACAS